MDKTLTFTDRQAFRKWLGEFGTESDGIWLLFGKKGDLKTLSASDALEEALCHGWIDGQIESIDDNSYKKYFARRRSESKWSVKNKELAQTLIDKGLMTMHGFEAIERARKNGAWDNAKRILIDDEQIQLFKNAVQPYEPAYTNLLTMSHSVQRAYTGFYFDARSDKTRQTRLEKIIDRLNRNLKPM
ncbi:MAG TPA: YdeI/OmpD-associated family protein [Bacteroidales bacterium]|nr:YdeI/OmpD-associated family protein [Bacteroidales bacterium]